MTPDKPNGHQVREAPAPTRFTPDYAREPAPSGARTWPWVLLALVLIGGAGYWYYARSHRAATNGTTAGGKGGPPGGRATPVVTATARKGELPIYLTGLGSVSALNTVTIRSRVDGQIIRIAYTEGQIVKQGDLLMEIDPRPFEVQLAQAEGQMARDQAQLENARLDLKRYQDAGTAVTAQQLDTQRSSVNQYEGATKVDQAAIDNAKLQITYSKITAPIDGRIGLRIVDQGNMIHANDPQGLAVITQLQPIAVLFNLPQDDIPQVLKKMNAGSQLPVDAYDRDLQKKLASGKLLAIDSQIDPTTGTLRFKAVFPNEDMALFPNQFVNARLLVDTLRDTILVPTAAIQRSPQSTFVYVVKDDDTVQMRDVAVGPTEGYDASVASGLSAGDVVVTDGTDKLTPGAKVSLGKPGGPGGAGGMGGTGGGKGRPGGKSGTGKLGATSNPAGSATTEPSGGADGGTGGGGTAGGGRPNGVGPHHAAPMTTRGAGAGPSTPSPASPEAAAAAPPTSPESQQDRAGSGRNVSAPPVPSASGQGQAGSSQDAGGKGGAQ